MDTPSERRVALVCHNWGHSSTFFTWNFTKQFMLRVSNWGVGWGSRRLAVLVSGRGPVRDASLFRWPQRVETEEGVRLDPRDKLFIVKVGWGLAEPPPAGGALPLQLRTARRYRHCLLHSPLRLFLPSFNTARRLLLQAGKEDSQGERWKVGGPLMPDLDTALRHYPHSEVKLEGGVRHNVPTFLQQQGIDILVVGDQWPQSGLQLTSGAVGARAGRRAGGMECVGGAPSSLPGTNARSQSRTTPLLADPTPPLPPLPCPSCFAASFRLRPCSV